MTMDKVKAGAHVQTLTFFPEQYVWKITLELLSGDGKVVLLIAKPDYRDAERFALKRSVLRHASILAIQRLGRLTEDDPPQDTEQA